jgi:hypothetical protein
VSHTIIGSDHCASNPGTSVALLTENEEDNMSFSYFDSSWMDDEDQEEYFGAGPLLEVSGHEQPEKFNLSLPSALGLQKCKKWNMQHTVEAEIQIKIGHCRLSNSSSPKSPFFIRVRSDWW